MEWVVVAPQCNDVQPGLRKGFQVGPTRAREAGGPRPSDDVRCERERGVELVELGEAVIRHHLGRAAAHSHKLVAGVAALVGEARDVDLGLGHSALETDAAASKLAG